MYVWDAAGSHSAVRADTRSRSSSSSFRSACSSRCRHLLISLEVVSTMCLQSRSHYYITAIHKYRSSVSDREEAGECKCLTDITSRGSLPWRHLSRPTAICASAARSIDCATNILSCGVHGSFRTCARLSATQGCNATSPTYIHTSVTGCIGGHDRE